MSLVRAPAAPSRRRPALAAAALTLVVVAGCGPSAEIVIALEAAAGNDLSAVEALRVTVRDLEQDEPEVFGPFELNRDEPVRLGATVEPGHDFYVDVWGCVSTSLCTPTQLAGRGCTEVIQVPAGTTDAAVTVVMYDATNLSPERCPPESP